MVTLLEVYITILGPCRSLLYLVVLSYLIVYLIVSI